MCFSNRQEVLEPYFGPMAEYGDFTVGAKGSAQFLVTREAVLSRPQALYASLFQWIMTTEMSDFWSGRMLEYTWHLIFDPIRFPLCNGTRPMSATPPPLPPQRQEMQVNVTAYGPMRRAQSIDLPPLYHSGRSEPCSFQERGREREREKNPLLNALISNRIYFLYTICFYPESVFV